MLAWQMAHTTRVLRLRFAMIRIHHRRGGGTRFAAVWENRNYTGPDLEHIDSTVTSAMHVAGTVGLSLAISRHGRLVFAKDYGLADNVTEAPMHVTSRLRIASVSKPFRAMEVLRLVEAGRLKLSDKVFGPGSLLGEAYGPASGYADSRVTSITLEELLRHTAGGWDNDGNDGTPDPMFLHTERSQADLIRWVLKNVPLEFAPRHEVPVLELRLHGAGADNRAHDRQELRDRDARRRVHTQWRRKFRTRP